MMGGAPTLLMVAILGVTYGWQPDGDQGVEYIIQIPPQQLAEIERMGEISSTIDPAVRGHVSKIIVRVGSEPLPRTMPPGISRFSSPIDSVALADHISIPIPESGVSLESTATTPEGRESVMKPQNIPSQGLSLPPSLNTGAAAGSGYGTAPGTQPPDFASRAQDEINAAAGRFSAVANGTVAAGADAVQRTGDAFRNTFSAATGGNVALPPGTGSATPNLQFTGDTGLARPRAGGPSTEPVNQRDNSWNNPTARWGSSTGVGATTPPQAATSTSGGFQGPSASDLNRYGQTDAAATRSTTNFAQLPSGMTLPGTSPPDANAAGNGRYSQGNQSAGAVLPPTGRFETGSQPGAAAVENPFPSRRNEPQVPAFAGQSSSANFGSSTTPLQSGVASQQPINRGQQPPGTWSVNAYGQPVDQQGRVLDPWGRPVETGGENLQAARESAAGGPGQGSPITRMAPPPSGGESRGGMTGVNPPAVQTSPRSYSDGDAEFGRRTASQTRYPSEGLDPRADADAGFRSTGNIDSGRSEASARGQTVTAQPLFNGMLLISIVANVYLIFWLKNLRHQFRDLVAAKRMAGSGVTSA